ncbi:hypothetical protein ACROYT_G012225 [Oculina patagonica]
MHLVRILITLHCLQLNFSPVSCGSCREELSQRGFALLNTTYSSKPVQRYQDCVFLCTYDPECMSFNFWWDSKKCDFNSKAREHSCKACFVEDASSTYMGMARYPGYPALAKSCSELKKLDPTAQSGTYVIDPDGDGGLAPLFDVTCDMSDKNGVGVTVISHDSENRMFVKGCNPMGCYSRDVNYTRASLSQLASLTRVSSHCEQFIKYECRGSAFYHNDKLFGWWVSRDGIKMNYWGGASPGSGEQICTCGMTNSCADPSDHCNCDKNDGVWREDSGLLTNKTDLPVKQLRFGDTGDSGEQGYHTLGKLKCYGMIS